MPANAALYLPAEHVDLRKLFPDAALIRGGKGPAFEVQLGADKVVFNVMPEEEIATHVERFLNYLRSLPDEENRRRDAIKVIRLARTVLGLKTSAEFTDNPLIWQSLFNIADRYDGYVFVHDSLLLPNGAVLVGPLRSAPLD